VRLCGWWVEVSEIVGALEERVGTCAEVVLF
jgi:hypothetical protein